MTAILTNPMLWGFLMIGINLIFTWLELVPCIDAMKYEVSKTKGIITGFTLTFRLIRHIPKAIPSIIDLGGMWLLTKLFTLGAGYAGGITGLFASNVLSIIIYYHTHMRGKQKEVPAIG